MQCLVSAVDLHEKLINIASSLKLNHAKETLAGALIERHHCQPTPVSNVVYEQIETAASSGRPERTAKNCCGKRMLLVNHQSLQQHALIAATSCEHYNSDENVQRSLS